MCRTDSVATDGASSSSVAETVISKRAGRRAGRLGTIETKPIAR